MSIIGLTDAPIDNVEQEMLGLKDHVDALKEFICQCETPITIACQGDWGTGKTSMMNMVCKALPSNTETCWFNTWQFSQFQMQDEIPLSLLSSFVDELGANDVSKVLRGLGKLVVNRLSDLAKAAAELSTGTGDLVKDALDNAIQQDNVMAVRKLRKEIELAVQKRLMQKQADRLVVFIDDLDRLVPERAVEILEIIKLFLDVKNCVFVLAVDYHVVSKGLEQKFGISMSDLKGKSFFDKIIQLPFNLPVAQYDIRGYMKALLAGFDFKSDDLDILVPLAEHSIGANPRSLKRLFNTLRLLNIVASKKSLLSGDATATAEERQRLLFAVLCLQLAYEPVYKMLLQEKHKLDSDYFKVLTDKDSLQESPEKLSVVQKALIGHGEINESMNRFFEFMCAFTDALRLDSQQEFANQDESSRISDQRSSLSIKNLITMQERDLLNTFLSLSALTSAGSSGAMAVLGEFRHKAEILNFYERSVKPKLDDAQNKMDSHVKFDYGEEFISFKEKQAWFGFSFKYYFLAFQLRIVWDDEKGCLKAVVLQERNEDKYFARYFFDFNEAFFPSLATDLRKSEFVFIELISFNESGLSKEDQKINRYFALTERTLDTLLPLLVNISVTKQPLIDRVIEFSDKIAHRLITDFPEHEGWIVENSMRDFDLDGSIDVTKSTWQRKFFIRFRANEAVFQSFYVGIVLDENWKCTKKLANNLYKTCEDKLFSGENNGSEYDYNDIWPFYTWLPEEFSNAYKGEFLESDFQYAFDTPQKESEAIKQIVDRFVRFKRILPELDTLASSVKLQS